MKICVQCRNEFQVFKEDREFYSKINVPPPTWCPDCRNMRRCAQRNERVLYMRLCDLCKRQTLSTFHADVPFPVYCTKCWWSDSWDALSYGRDFDFSRPFFDQFIELSNAVPHLALNVKEMENSDYCQYAEGLKDSYLAICSFFGRNILYTYWMGWSEDLYDCNYVLHSERLYECQDVQKSYNCQYVFNSYAMTDSAFCFSCSDCVDCFMCVNLRHKSYCIENIQYTKEEYQRKMKEYNIGSYTQMEKLKLRLWNFAAIQPHKYAFIRKSEDCIGDNIDESKDAHFAFDVYRQERGRYLFDAGYAKECVDLLQFGIDCELDYEGHDGGWSYNAHFVTSAAYAMNCEYVSLVRNVQDCFGCFGLQKKQYCILNRQYTKEEYGELRSRIIEYMKKAGEYGEFFPIMLSSFAYNESMAQNYYPLTKEEALIKGYKWRDEDAKEFAPSQIMLPDSIDEIDASICEKAFSCISCGRNYRIIPQEFKLMKTMLRVAIPKQCFFCRHKRRFHLRNPRKLWDRNCQKCQVPIKTSYAPERPETVYCEKCYLETVY